jgi:hypothetical protein
MEKQKTHLITAKEKNIRISLKYFEKDKIFCLQFKRLLNKGEVVEENEMTIVKGRIMVTNIILSELAGMALCANFHMLISMVRKNKIPNLRKYFEKK